MSTMVILGIIFNLDVSPTIIKPDHGNNNRSKSLQTGGGGGVESTVIPPFNWRSRGCGTPVRELEFPNCFESFSCEGVSGCNPFGKFGDCFLNFESLSHFPRKNITSSIS